MATVDRSVPDGSDPQARLLQALEDARRKAEQLPAGPQALVLQRLDDLNRMAASGHVAEAQRALRPLNSAIAQAPAQADLAGQARQAALRAPAEVRRALTHLASHLEQARKGGLAHDIRTAERHLREALTTHRRMQVDDTQRHEAEQHLHALAHRGPTMGYDHLVLSPEARKLASQI